MFNRIANYFLYKLGKNSTQLHTFILMRIHDKCYAKILKETYKRRYGKKLNLDLPTTFEEKINWLKVYDSTPLKTRLADKFLVRGWIKEKLGEKYLVPLLGVWNSFDEINFDALPNSFVLKANHGAGWNIIVPDKSLFDISTARRKFYLWMKTNASFRNFEMHYKNIPPKIIAEEYLVDEELIDYKFFCSNDEVRFFWIVSGRLRNYSRYCFDLHWNPIPIKNKEPNAAPPPEPPAQFDEMVHIAKQLCQGFIHVRVDLFWHRGKVFFNEMTFTSYAGKTHSLTENANRAWGDLIRLPIETDRRHDAIPISCS